ncbi:FAD-dependent monooxygenase [Luedemannella helvata]|uniref:FAD-dependent monooxygenase n=1 Tax=Luedemannella helvata TaxID=349315 RepID=A0ABP4VUP5_9ACTN
MRCATTEPTIIGAGIAGLTLAAALGREGTGCTVYEQADAFTGVGAGVQLTPNATRLLRRLGLGAWLAGTGVRPTAIELRDWRSGSVLTRVELGRACEERYGAPYYTIHRADLHEGLRALVADRCGAHTVRVGRRCVAVREREDDVEVRFADGSAVAADLVVGADGVHSVVRAALSPDASRPTGTSVYRALVPAAIVPRLATEPRVLLWPGPGRHVVCYPVRGGAWLNVVATVPDATRCQPADAYRGWYEDVLGLLTAGEPTTWAVHDRPAPPLFGAGRIALTGDAAHPVLPFAAQGANQAIEDAVVLAGCLRLPERRRALGEYERLRRPRVARIAAASRANGERLHRPDADRRDLFDSAWIYGHDAELAVPAGGRR